jgi:hypothetical protein
LTPLLGSDHAACALPPFFVHRIWVSPAVFFLWEHVAAAVRGCSLLLAVLTVSLSTCYAAFWFDPQSTRFLVHCVVLNDIARACFAARTGSCLTARRALSAFACRRPTSSPRRWVVSATDCSACDRAFASRFAGDCCRSSRLCRLCWCGNGRFYGRGGDRCCCFVPRQAVVLRVLLSSCFDYPSHFPFFSFSSSCVSCWNIPGNH